MNEEEFAEKVVGTLDAETFDVLDYLDNQPIAFDTVDIYTDLQKTKELSALLEARNEYLELRRRAEQRGEAPSLALTDEDEDTEFDDQINALLEDLEETKLVFHLKSVAPSLEKAIKKSYIAKADPNLEREERAEYDEKMYADILSRAIDYVVTGTGAVDKTLYTPERLEKLQERLYAEQSEKLLTALSRMVYAGAIFENTLTADFS